MESLRGQRVAALFGIGIATAAILGATANLLGLGRDATYVLAASAVALVAGFGVPWVLGWSRFGILFKDRHRMHSYEAAVLAGHIDAAKTHAGGVEFVLVKGVEKDRIFAPSPLTMPAGWAKRASTSLGENPKETLKISHEPDPTR